MMKREKIFPALAAAPGSNRLKNGLAGAFSLSLVFLLIEFYDELHYAAGGAVLPSLRGDLLLTYAQVGLLLGLPHVVGVLVEPFLMLLGDAQVHGRALRRVLILGGGVALVLTLLLTGGARSFPVVLLAALISFPASGAFVSLSQAALIELNPGREAQAMARWSAAGSLGNLLGPLGVAGGFALALGWRWVFFALAGLVAALLLVLALTSHPPLPSPPAPLPGTGEGSGIEGSFLRSMGSGLVEALRAPGMLRWLLLLSLSDLLLDTFTDYAALYFSDVMGLAPAQTGLMVGLLMATGLACDLALIPLLERLPGRRVVRITALLALVVYPAWLLAPWQGGAALALKAVLLVGVRACTLGWYPVLKAETFAAAPGRAGAVQALDSIGGLIGGVLIGFTGWAAGQWGLPAAMWLLLAGPLGLAVLVGGSRDLK